MTGGSAQRPILPPLNKKVAGSYESKEINKGPGMRKGGRGKGYTKTFGKINMNIK